MQSIHATKCLLGTPLCARHIEGARNTAESKANAMPLRSFPSEKKQKVKKQTNHVIPESAKFGLLVAKPSIVE